MTPIEYLLAEVHATVDARGEPLREGAALVPTDEERGWISEAFRGTFDRLPTRDEWTAAGVPLVNSAHVGAVE